MHDAFLSAIIAAPDDDAPRLIYADWLDENGQHDRAELIRVQCELARTEPWTPRHAELAARAKALLTPANVEAWAVPLGFKAYPNNFHRGFVERDCFSPSRFLALAPAIFERAPLRQVDLMTPDAGGDVYTGVKSAAEEMLRDEVVGSSLLAPARELTLFDLGPGTAARLARSRHLRRLETLELYGGPAADALEAIAAGRLTGLCRLTLSTHDDPPPDSPRDAGLAALERSNLASRLTELSLLRLHVTAAGVTCLASDRWAALRSLYLDDDKIGNAGVAAVLRSPLAPQWTALAFRGRWLTGRGVRAVADCPGLANLNELCLEARRVTADDLTRLLRSPHLGRLRELMLSAVNPDMFLTAAAKVPQTARLRRIYLGEGCRMTEVGAKALLRASPLDEVASIGFVGRPSEVPWSMFERLIRKLGPRLDLY